VVAFFASLALLATRPLFRHLTTRLPSAPDVLIDLWVLDWLTEHLLPPREVFGGNIFHPFGGGILRTDPSLGTAVFLLPLRLFPADPVLLYNLGLLVALTFSGWAFHRLALDMTGRRSAGLLAGVLATFTSHQMSHIYHLNLLTTGWIALFALGLRRLGQRPGPAAALLTGVSFSLTVQSSGYYAVPLVVMALVFAAFHRHELVARRAALAVAAAVAVAVLLTAPFLLAYTRLHAEESWRRPLGMSVNMAFQPGRDLTSVSYAWRGLLGTAGERMFPGLLVLILGTLAAFRRARPVPWLFASAALLVLLSLGPTLSVGGRQIALPYRWLMAVPPFDSMRHPYTFAAVATLLLAVAAGVGWSSLRLARNTWAGAAVVAAAVLETLAPPIVLRPAPAGLPPVYERLREWPRGGVVEIPVMDGASLALLWAARVDWPFVNGDGAFPPLYTLTLNRYVQNHWLARTPADVDASRPTAFLRERFDARYVVLRCGQRPDLRELAEAFDRSRSFRLAFEAEDGDRVYEIAPAVAAKPAAWVPRVALVPALLLHHRLDGFGVRGQPGRDHPSWLTTSWVARAGPVARERRPSRDGPPSGPVQPSSRRPL
jgi:hypothetical protein